MPDLFESRRKWGGLRQVGCRPDGEMPVGAARPTAKEARATPTGIGYLAPTAIVVFLPAVVVATVAFKAAFSATFEVATRALPVGGLTAARADAVESLAREWDRRRATLSGYDLQITKAAGDPLLRAAWSDLRRREAEAVEQLERHLDHVRRPHTSPPAADRAP